MNESSHLQKIASKAQRIVVKVGTSVLAAGEGRSFQQCVQSVASEIAALWRDEKQKRQVIVVTSGAIGVGMGIMKLKNRPTELAKLQAAAATGQGLLMQWYTARLEEARLHAAQILLTRGDLEDPRRYLNVKATLQTLLEEGIVPIINENDTVSVEEIRYGDNDILSAHVAVLVGADLLILLSDVDKLIGPTDPLHVVTRITPEIERAAQGTTKEISTGGMRSKLEAAKIVMEKGIPMIVMNGRGRSNLLEVILEGKTDRGTWFIPERSM